jgi:2-oxoglutarate dehydrogenase E2 component (dihydrolipoamide succinyltransferase)
MPLELKVPVVGESITEVEIGGWLKKQGEVVQKDEPVVTLESEKATVELPAPEAGTITQVLKQKGEVAKVGEVIAYLEKDGQAKAPQKPAEKKAEEKPQSKPASPTEPGSVARAANEGSVARPASDVGSPARPAVESKSSEKRVMPAAQRALEEHGLSPEQVEATGPGGRLLKEDVLRHVEAKEQKPATPTAQVPPTATPQVAPLPERQEEVIPMSRLRRTVAERLVQAQHAAALLTTINEIDMSAVMALREEYGEAFQQKYNVKLGFMSFFVKACIDALKQFPALNAEVRGANIVYHNFYDIGVAIGSGKGLVVPVLRNAERMSFAEIEVAIGDFARRSKENKLKVDELQGGTFTISNGGVYGSLLSTPIVNPPQSGVMGLHAIQERPVAREGNVVIRPMMYISLTYDHRLVDGREAVSCLKRIKEAIESPARLLIEV